MIHEDIRNTEKRLADVEKTVQATHALVMELHEIVMSLVKGISTAQQSGGMAGMMARQLPDMTGMGI